MSFGCDCVKYFDTNAIYNNDKKIKSGVSVRTEKSSNDIGRGNTESCRNIFIAIWILLIKRESFEICSHCGAFKSVSYT